MAVSEASGSASGSSLFVFGLPSGSSSSASSGGLFGASSSSTSLFGSTSSASSGGGLFGTASSTGGLFGGGASGGSLFGTSPASAGYPASGGGGLFGGPPLFSQNASGSTTNMFQFGAAAGGSSSSSSSTDLFGYPSPSANAADRAATENDDAGDDGNDERYVPEEEVTTVDGWAPSVSLQMLDQIETGEINEDELYSQRSKLYRFREGEWKERGLGDAKLLKHKETGKVRFLLRQEKTEKIVANHYVLDKAPYCDLRPNADSDKCWVWTACDCSDGEPLVEKFALKFGLPENAAKFKKAFDEAKALNAQVKDFASEITEVQSS